MVGPAASCLGGVVVSVGDTTTTILIACTLVVSSLVDESGKYTGVWSSSPGFLVQELPQSVSESNLDRERVLPFRIFAGGQMRVGARPATIEYGGH